MKTNLKVWSDVSRETGPLMFRLCVSSSGKDPDAEKKRIQQLQARKGVRQKNRKTCCGGGGGRRAAGAGKNIDDEDTTDSDEDEDGDIFDYDELDVLERPQRRERMCFARDLGTLWRYEVDEAQIREEICADIDNNFESLEQQITLFKDDLLPLAEDRMAGLLALYDTVFGIGGVAGGDALGLAREDSSVHGRERTTEARRSNEELNRMMEREGDKEGEQEGRPGEPPVGRGATAAAAEQQVRIVFLPIVPPFYNYPSSLTSDHK